VSTDLLNDANITDKEWVKREQMTAFAGFPLCMENRLVGVMAMFSRQPFPDEVLALMGAVADVISQGILRKQAEEKIVEQATLLDQSHDAILVTDLDGHCTYWNKSAERLYGIPAQEAYGQRADQLLCVERAYFENARMEVSNRGQWKDDACQATVCGKTIVVESRWTLVMDERSQPKSIMVVNTDISEKKQIEAQFLRTQRIESIGKLAGGIAHDLNNVLSPIVMSVELLKLKCDDEHSRRMLSVLEVSAKRGADMVKQILTFSRGVDGERILLQTKHLIKEVAKIVADTFPKNIRIRSDVPDTLWTVLGDATQLHQVFMNLAVNARDAMPTGGTITISADNTVVEPNQEQTHGDTTPGFYVLIKVADTGSGVPPEVLARIFEPFFSTKETGKGTGLGLSTALGIVKNHGGFLRVDTEANKGSEFSVYLPATDAFRTQLTPEPELRSVPTGRGEIILAVDDEAGVLTMIKEVLETYGYRVLSAKDGTEAVATFTAHRDQIRGVLVDMLMPHMDGPATIRVLKKLEPQVNIIAASGLMDSEKVRDATGLDNLAFLMKPFTAERLLNAVHDLLKQ
jgi:PAS domain S-box-containing protein